MQARVFQVGTPRANVEREMAISVVAKIFFFVSQDADIIQLMDVFSEEYDVWHSGCIEGGHKALPKSVKMKKRDRP